MNAKRIITNLPFLPEECQRCGHFHNHTINQCFGRPEHIFTHINKYIFHPRTQSATRKWHPQEKWSRSLSPATPNRQDPSAQQPLSTRTDRCHSCPSTFQHMVLPCSLCTGDTVPVGLMIMVLSSRGI